MHVWSRIFLNLNFPTISVIEAGGTFNFMEGAPKYDSRFNGFRTFCHWFRLPYLFQTV